MKLVAVRVTPVRLALAALGTRVVLNDAFGADPVVVVFDQSTQLVIAYAAVDGAGSPLTFDAADVIP